MVAKSERSSSKGKAPGASTALSQDVITELSDHIDIKGHEQMPKVKVSH